MSENVNTGAAIRLLDKDVYELIAAGEVIERPASVVKELIENSIDAGARVITVEIKNGGISFIRITDDGVGIPYEQCPTAFLRHATSKVRTAEDLEAIATLGFRGEALASVAAVGRVSLLSKTAGADSGASYIIEGGKPLEHERLPCPDGTTIIIRELFFNIPARLKFLKKDLTEGNYIRAVIEKAALSNPEVAFRFIRDNELVRVTPGDGKLHSALYAVYGADFASNALLVNECGEGGTQGIRVTGAVIAPLAAKNNRTYQNFFVNARYVRSSTFTAALEEGFRGRIMSGKFPACVLNLELAPSEVDANVHPAKTEVRFSKEYERSVFGAIHRAVKNALLNAQQLDETQIRSAAEPIRKAPEIALRAAPSPFAEGAAFEYKYINPEEYVREIPVQEQFPNSKTTEQGSIAIWGELFSTYVVCEQSGNLVLIDKHAAHERLEFERLKAQWKAHSQLLLEPVEIGEEQLGAHSIGELLENAPQLAKIGVIIERAESDKEEKLFITAFPTLLRTSSAQQLLCEVAQSLAKGGNAEFCSLIDEALHRVACHAAIKAGDKSDALDIRLLAERVLNDTTGQLRHCPHGRPIVVEITKQELEKRFRRVL